MKWTPELKVQYDSNVLILSSFHAKTVKYSFLVQKSCFWNMKTLTSKLQFFCSIFVIVFILAF